MRLPLDEHLPIALSSRRGHRGRSRLGRDQERRAAAPDEGTTRPRHDGARYRVPAQRLGIALWYRGRSRPVQSHRDLRPLVPSILAAIDTVEPGLVWRVAA